ncbi:hypothetical protein BD410DRAFT_809884 [Rickenella mellea]|uniref:Uncharacterized protein n=1 Tax=Rickenella mellea TaxID=50990 RepID=A0A4Y7PGV8_9AGAM|nr:hypothetical protein BD410DRAFT_809884 [Rickenella mellea]
MQDINIRSLQVQNQLPSRSAQTYTANLATYNSLLEAKNFLVFQGIDRNQPVEQISGLLEPRRSTAVGGWSVMESVTESFNKRWGFAGKIKVYKEQMTEVERFESLMQEQLYDIEQNITSTLQTITKKTKTLTSCGKSHIQEEDRNGTRSQQKATARTLKDGGVMQVCVRKEMRKRKAHLEGLWRDLKVVQKAADAARDAGRKVDLQNFSPREANLKEYGKVKQAGTRLSDTHDLHETKKTVFTAEAWTHEERSDKNEQVCRRACVDVCMPTQRNYGAAKLVMLGRNIGAVGERTAIDCIEYFCNHVAKLILLDTILVQPINDKILSFANGGKYA